LAQIHLRGACPTLQRFKRRFDESSNGYGQLSSERASKRGVQTIARTFSFDAYARPVRVQSQIEQNTYVSRAVFDQHSRPFQSFFQAQSDGLSELGEYFEYDSIGYPLATYEVLNGARGVLYSRNNGTDNFGNVVNETRSLSTSMTVLRQYNPATNLAERRF
jgi:hypothetical protein